MPGVQLPAAIMFSHASVDSFASRGGWDWNTESSQVQVCVPGWVPMTLLNWWGTPTSEGVDVGAALLPRAQQAIPWRSSHQSFYGVCSGFEAVMLGSNKTPG